MPFREAIDRACAKHADLRKPREDREKLWERCQAFIAKQRITCPETIAQTDRVIQNAYEFIEGVCNIVGYHKDEDDDDEEEEHVSPGAHDLRDALYQSGDVGFMEDVVRKAVEDLKK